MSEYGRILSANYEIDGSELRIDHLAGVTELDLEDALVFIEPEEGEVLQVRITSEDGATTELVTIKVPETEDEITVDDDNDDHGLITLVAPTVNAYLAGDRVTIEPETRRLIAHVRLDDDDQDDGTVDAIVNEPLYTHVPEGSDLDLAVQLVYDGEDYFVVDIIGREPEIDGSLITPGTFPDSVLEGDGLTPDDPTEAPIILRGAPAINVVDMSAYSRPADFQSFLVEFATSDDNGATFGDWENLGISGSLQPHPALDYALQYKYRYQVLDIEGLLSGFSPESDPVVPRQVGEAGAIDIAADSIVTDMLAALIVLTSMLRVENAEGRVDIGDGAIRAFNNDGEETFRVDGVNNFINGAVVTAILTVLENLVIRTAAELSGGATMRLLTGVSDPPSEPQALWELDSAQLGTGTATRAGLKAAVAGADGSTPVFIGGQGDHVREWSQSTLAQLRTVNSFASGINIPQVQGVVYHPGTDMYWFMGQLAADSGFPNNIAVHPIQRSNMDGPAFSVAFGTNAGDAMPDAGGIATDGTDLFIAAVNRTTDKVRVARYTLEEHPDPSAGIRPVFQERLDTTVELADDEAINDIEIHDGKWWFLISRGATANVRVCLEDWGARSDADDFDAPTRGGLAWDGTQFRVHQRASGAHTIYKFTNWIPADNVHAAYAYADTVADDETALSPIKTLLLADTKQRWRLRQSVPSLPVGADAIRYYLLEAASATIATMRLQEEIADSTVTFDSYNASGAQTAVAATEFPASAPATIESFSGDTRIGGDDDNLIPGLFKETFKRKTATETVGNNTLQDDDHLFQAVEANSVYIVDALVLWEAPTAADFQFTWTIPPGASGKQTLMNRWSAADAFQRPVTVDWTAVQVLGGLDSVPLSATIKGTLVTGANAGNLQFRWARDVSSGTNAQVFINSWLKLQKVA